MSTPLHIAQDGRTIVVRGNAAHVLQVGGFRGIYVGTVRGWMLDSHRLPDLLAYLDSRGISYRLSQAGEAA